MVEADALAGIKVIALTRLVAAPFTAYQLALHGAEVINIETPNGGDMYRTNGDPTSSLIKGGMGCGFLAQGANKKSVTLNIATPEGQEILRKLIADADVFIENLRCGAMARYGLGYEDLIKLNPRLVYCSVTGYGQTGPKKNDPAMDMAIQAASGMMSVNGTVESGPVKTSFPLVDYSTGLSATIGIMMALFKREHTGRGQQVDVSMLETALVMMSSFVTDYMTEGVTHGLVGNGSGRGGYIHNLYKTAEGALLIAASTAAQRKKLWEVMDMADIEHDPRFATDTLCRKNVKALEGELENRLLLRTAMEWETFLQSGGVTAMAIHTIQDIANSPQIAARRFLHTFPKDPQFDLSFTVPTTSYKLSETPARLTTPPPRLGQHTDETLATLGFSVAEVAKMRSAGII